MPVAMQQRLQHLLMRRSLEFCHRPAAQQGLYQLLNKAYSSHKDGLAAAVFSLQLQQTIQKHR